MDELAGKHDNASLLVHMTAILVGILLSVFFVSTVNNMATITMRAESVTWGPYPISIAVGRVETNIVHLKLLFEKMDTQERNEDTINETAQTYDEIMSALDTQFATIQDANTTNIQSVQDLIDIYADFDDITDQLLAYYSDLSISNLQWRDYLNVTVLPSIDTILNDTSQILEFTTSEVTTAYYDAKKASTQTVLLACGLMAAVAAMIVVYLACLRRKNIQEEKLMDALSGALANAQSASAAKSDFLSNMSHDIRTPLNAIIGLTLIANENFDNQLRVKQCLNRIATSSQHLLSLINDVLDMNKIESGKVELSVEEFSLSELTTEIVNIVTPQVRDKNLICDVEIEGIEHEKLIGDSLRLRQIFLNLLSNAIKYTNERDSITVSIRELKSTDTDYIDFPTKQLRAPKNGSDVKTTTIQFKFADTGIGMKADFLEFIFQPFERERNDFTNFTEGTGLGMAITKKLVELMSGNINVQSELGIGSVFTINIPFQISSNEDTYDLRGFENLNVLIIASTKTIVESASSFLTELDVKHQKTINGSEGILLAKKACENNRDFDAIIIGPKMEDLDGIDVAKSIRRVTNRDKTQVFLAVYEESVYQGKGYDEYIDALVLKPLYKTHIYKLLKSKCVDHTKENVLKFKRKKPQYKARILLVEDNELNMEIAKEILKSYGIRIEEATDGLEAFSALSTKEENYYDLIFMDCQMPHMDGLEATEAIVKFENNSQRNHTPIVAMTANAFDEDRKNALAAGMDDFLVKPLDVKELENILSKFLDSAN